MAAVYEEMDMPYLGGGLRLPKAAATSQILLVVGLRHCVVPDWLDLSHHRALHASPSRISFGTLCNGHGAYAVFMTRLQNLHRTVMRHINNDDDGYKHIHRAQCKLLCQHQTCSGASRCRLPVTCLSVNSKFKFVDERRRSLTPSSVLSFSRCCLAAAACSSL